MIPTIIESGQQMNDIQYKIVDVVPTKYIFFMSITDLFDNKIKTEINVKNNDVISNFNLKDCTNF